MELQIDSLLAVPILKKSKLVETFAESNLDDLDNIPLPDFINLDSLTNINRQNINNVIRTLDYFLVDKDVMRNYIINNSETTMEPYIIDPQYEHMIDLPQFMKNDCNEQLQSTKDTIQDPDYEEVYFDRCPGYDSYLLESVHDESLVWLKFLFENRGNYKCSTHRIMVDAATTGNIFIFKYLHENGFAWNTKVMNSAIKSKNDDCFKYALIYNCPIDQYTIYKAASDGTLMMLKWLIDHIVPSVYERSYLELGRYRGSQKSISKERELFINGLKNDDPNICKYLLSLGGDYNFDHEDINTIARYANIDTFKLYIKSNKFNKLLITDDFFSILIANNQIEIIKYAYELGMFQYWNNNIFILERGLIDLAGQYNRLEIMKFFLEKNYDWGLETIKYCILWNSYECLKYAHMNGCPVGDINSIELPSCLSNLNCMKYINENIIDLKDNLMIKENLETSSWRLKINTLNYLDKIGFKFTDKCINGAIKNDSKNIIIFYLEKGFEINDEHKKNLIKNKSIDCLKYLVEKNYLKIDESFIEDIIERDFVDCLKYLCKKHKLQLSNELYIIACSSFSERCGEYIYNKGYYVEGYTYEEKMIDFVKDEFDY